MTSGPARRDEATVGAHEERVARIARALAERTGARPLSIKKKAVSHRVPKPGDSRYSDDRLDISDLDHVLVIDAGARTCTAEPGVTFVDLVQETLRHGLVPLVVPELRTITIGGAVTGCSLESTSFRYGGFHDSCLEYEVVTTSGEVFRCAPDGERPLVFEMMHGSFGTLGILTRLTFRLAPAKSCVHLTYRTHATAEAFREDVLERCLRDDVDFMDGIIHAPGRYVLSLGRFAEEAPYTNRYDWVTPYYQTTARRTEDWFTTTDYFFRYDRGVTSVRPRSLLGRVLLGRFLHSSQVLRLADGLAWALPRERPVVTVDLFVPVSRFTEFMSWYWAEFGPHPLWCVPYRLDRPYPWLADTWRAGLEDRLLIDLAIYGFRQRDGRNRYRLLEEKLQELNGVKTLISFNYYSEEEFWRIFHRENHLAAKAVCDPRGLMRDLYTKTCVAAQGREPRRQGDR
jgi:FAD/FMN-containing dehydrogenase